ncbi:hypothetical protein ACLM5J_18515 [Nocardioides sp. Bht2]|uniref:hypothetical protein n=1 Tax=Nocardioides sp. Bht2 TaxID=3392297 RepID=UPI0039B60641
MPQSNSTTIDYLRSARAGILGGLAVTTIYCLILIRSTPRPSNSEVTSFAALVVALTVCCALLASGAAVTARAGVRLLGAFLAGLLGGPAFALAAQFVLDGVPQGEGDTDRFLVGGIAAALFGALVGAMCWVGGRR